LCLAALCGGVPAVLLPACAEGETVSGDGEAPRDPAEPEPQDNDDPSGGICLLNNCASDEECKGCPDGRSRCMVAENRCVACDPVTGQGCPEGQSCSSYGICAPAGQTCPTDDKGNPQVACNTSDDCKACSPMHQICDQQTHKCQACLPTNTQHCLSSDICVDGKCSPKCPQSCTKDSECGQCGAPGKEAHACYQHKCAECSDTYPCAAGLVCKAGSCVPQCGLAGPTAGTCKTSEDCKSCGDGKSGGAWSCKKPINAGANDLGTCGPSAAGCSDLGKSVAVLPPPWDQYTNACSKDADCSGVGIQYNVGKLVKDIVGDDEINLGFTKVKIHDANVTYGMNKCADIKITENLSCGVCVPCEVDADCKPIGLDPLIAQLFKGEPLAQIAGALLLDLLYGNNAQHNLYFYCQPVAAGYGVCAPCANPTQACGQSGGGGSGGGAPSGGSCTHSPCATGAKLSASCDGCAATVCSYDAYCCSTEWDNICVSEAKQYCGATCNGGGGTGGGGTGGSSPSSCSHTECIAGAKLSKSCSLCAASVCKYDAYCCDVEWDQQCVSEAATDPACPC
jgi:hypothetical protein